MARDAQPPETFDETESPIPLRTMGDVERALARVVRQIHKGSLEPGRGHSLVIALGTLAKVKRENQGDDLVKRLESIEARISQ